jgi:hypothetical protein
MSRLPSFHASFLQSLRGFKVGILMRATSLWLGAHWSPGNKRLCINVMPFVTLYIVWPGGIAPRPTCSCPRERDRDCPAHGHPPQESE